ncbi:Hypothetical predicted protein [Cloeon dipterum]|uniref:MARVEL domain-containing protein n=1 Tax=Cloeon dipterum TaxID=197152 RepID=A0A8S1DJ12_9INSE|nr:Hypothetical predicted protein [Cloeon dipterum]
MLVHEPLRGACLVPVWYPSTRRHLAERKGNYYTIFITIEDCPLRLSISLKRHGRHQFPWSAHDHYKSYHFQLVQIVCNMIGFLCVILAKYSHLARSSFFKSLSGIGFWFTGIMLLLYVFHVAEKFFRIPWLKIELGFCTLWTLLYLIASILCVDYASLDAAFGAAGFFGFCAMFAYGFDAYLKFQAVRNGELAQGDRVHLDDLIVNKVKGYRDSVKSYIFEGNNLYNNSLFYIIALSGDLWKAPIEMSPRPHTALQFDIGTKQLTLGKIDKPQVSRPDEILVKVAYSGICGTDLHVIHGQFPCKKTAFALGHEFSGVVEAIGADVQYLTVGDRVVVDPNSGCGHCDSCWNASYHRCSNVRTIGILADGGWAEFCVARKGQVYKLPDSVTLKQGALCEPMSCIAHGWDRLGSMPHNSKILIMGAGIIGNLWACLFHLNGHRSNVTISEPQDTRRKLVEKLELGYTLTSPTVLAAQNPEFDLVVDCSGSAVAMQQAVKWLKMGGKLMVFGVANPKAVMEVSPYDIMKKELTILGALTNPFTFPEAIAILKMMGPRYLDYDRLGVETFSLSGYGDAMKSLEAASVAKAVFEINPEK